jgi:hypothetical protein
MHARTAENAVFDCSEKSYCSHSFAIGWVETHSEIEAEAREARR